MSRCDPVQNLLRLDLQVLFPGGEGLKPSLPTLRGVEGDFPVLLNPQGVRSLLDHRAVHRLIDRRGPGIEIQRLQQSFLVRRVPVVQGIGPCVDRAEGRLRKQHHIGGQGIRQRGILKGKLASVGDQVLQQSRQNQTGLSQLGHIVIPCLLVVVVQGIRPPIAGGDQKRPGLPLPPAALAGKGDIIEKVIVHPAAPLAHRALPCLPGAGLGGSHGVQRLGQQVVQPIVVQPVHRCLIVLHPIASCSVLHHQAHRGSPGQGGILNPRKETLVPCSAPLLGDALKHPGPVDEKERQTDQQEDEEVFQPVNLPAAQLPSHPLGPSLFSSIRRVVPGPGRSTRLRLPSCWRMISWAMESPRPVPPDSRERALSTR